MRDLIIEGLNRLEEERGINILYACESGSRAWGFPSPDSDYDVRFIYCYDEDWYLSIARGRDNIDLPVNGDLDLGGWELAKTLSLAGKSNAVVWEWLQSPIIYRERCTFREELFALLAGYFSPKAACYHYLSMAKRTMDEHLQGNELKLKKYFYMLRPLLAARWICENGSVPPMEFAPLLEQIAGRSELMGEIKRIMQVKEGASEGEMIARSAVIDSFCREELSRCDEMAPGLAVASEKSFERLNVFLRKQVREG